MAKIQITTSGIKKSLGKYDYLQAISEYIWNGFDAKASKIEVVYKRNSLDGIEEISIRDNGYGIPKNELSKKFVPFFESEKLVDPNIVRTTSAVHGKNGVGRLTFFKFATQANWETTYKEGNKNYTYAITIESKKLEDYKDTNLYETTNPVGTIVTFSGLSGELSTEKIEKFLIKEFCWFLELNRLNKYSITIDGKELDYSSNIADTEDKSIIHKDSNTVFEIKYIQWTERINNEYSRFYCINSTDKEILKKATTLNNKGDSFYHSLFIKSKFFDDFIVFSEENEEQDSILCHSNKSDEYKFLIKEIDKYLKSKRKPFLKVHVDEVVCEFKRNKAFPSYDTGNAWDTTRAFELENVVKELYQVEPKLFSNLNLEQQKTFIRFLDLIMDTGECGRLLDILNEIVELEPEEREELSHLLKTSKFSSIIKTIKLIEDRYKAIDELKRLVFDTNLYANEVYHLQNFIEKHYWIFGEQYSLVTAAEPKFEEALRRYTYILTGEKKEIHIEHPDKEREMDIFAVRQDIQNNTIKNIVVELKHPKVNLGEEELRQVKKYLGVIQKEDRFNANNEQWEFYLVGNGFDTSEYIEGEIANAKHHGENSLVYQIDRYKIYVKKWSEIFAEFEIRHKFLNDKLQIERQKLIDTELSADEIIANLDNNTAIQPKETEVV